VVKEVKARLTLEDAASKTIDKVKSGFGELLNSEKAAQEGMSGIKQALSTMAGVYLPQLTRQAYEFGKGFLTAASHGYADDAAIAALSSTVQGIPWEEAIGAAGRYGDELDKLGIQNGVLNESLGNGFQRLLEINGATADGVARSRGEIAQLAVIADRTGLSLEGASQEIAFMGEGILKAKGRMAQLLQATGVFGPSLKEAAKGWAQLTEEKRMDILEKGLELASSKMEGMPRTFNSLLVSLENIGKISQEKLGEPLVDAIAPELENLIDWLDKNRDGVEEFAKSMAKDVKHWAEVGANEVKEGWQYLQTHADEIKNAVVEGFETARSVVSWILDHKEELAIAFGAKTMLPGAAGLLKPGFGVLSGVYKAGAAGIGADGLGAAKLVGAAGGAVALGAFALAIGGATLAVDQFSKLMDETNGGKGDNRMSFEALQERFQEMIDNPDSGVWDDRQLASFEHMRENITRLAEELGENSSAAGALADAAFNAHRAMRNQLEGIDAIAQSLESLDTGSDEGIATEKAGVDIIANVFTQAMTASDAGTQAYIANMLAKSQALQNAFLMSSDMTGAGFDALAELVKGQAEGFADKLRQKADLAGSSAKPDVPKVQFNGGQSFKINQDFRDEDPNKVALVFTKGVLDAAEKRLQAVTGVPFGG
jgi:hypothetical protein